MSVGLYPDVHVPASITRGLVLRGVDVLTPQIDATTELKDPDLLDRATELSRVLFSQDEDLLAEATKRQRSGKHFAGVIYAHQLGITIGKAIEDLEILAQPGRWKTSQIELSIYRCDDVGAFDGTSANLTWSVSIFSDVRLHNKGKHERSFFSLSECHERKAC